MYDDVLKKKLLSKLTDRCVPLYLENGDDVRALGTRDEKYEALIAKDLVGVEGDNMSGKPLIRNSTECPFIRRTIGIINDKGSASFDSTADLVRSINPTLHDLCFNNLIYDKAVKIILELLDPEAAMLYAGKLTRHVMIEVPIVDARELTRVNIVTVLLTRLKGLNFLNTYQNNCESLHNALCKLALDQKQNKFTLTVLTPPSFHRKGISRSQVTLTIPEKVIFKLRGVTHTEKLTLVGEPLGLREILSSALTTCDEDKRLENSLIYALESYSQSIESEGDTLIHLPEVGEVIRGTTLC